MTPENALHQESEVNFIRNPKALCDDFGGVFLLEMKGSAQRHGGLLL